MWGAHLGKELSWSWTVDGAEFAPMDNAIHFRSAILLFDFPFSSFPRGTEAERKRKRNTMENFKSMYPSSQAAFQGRTEGRGLLTLAFNALRKDASLL